MDIFDFPYHTLEVKYPESSATVSFGGGYDFTSMPKAPDQVEYTLNYEAMFFFETVTGYADEVSMPKLNMKTLELFYQKHRLHGKFIYPHPTEGDLVVKFVRPLEYKIAKNGKGRVDPFSIVLKLQP